MATSKIKLPAYSTSGLAQAPSKCYEIVMIHNSVLSLIGNTPIIELTRLHTGPGKLFAKAEFLNPGASVKDRVARHVITAAKVAGRLHDGQCVVEATSGNMGAGLALVCAALGHPFVAVMSKGQSEARARMLLQLGAKVMLVDQIDGVPGKVTGNDMKTAARVAKQFATQNGGYYVNQFTERECVEAHFRSTGPEILAELAHVDVFASCVGSGATFVGVSRALKTKWPSAKCIAVEAMGCEALSKTKVTKPRHIIQGTGFGIVPPLWDESVCDGFAAVSDDEVLEMQLRLGKLEGLYVGFSAAANVLAAKRILDSHKEGLWAIVLLSDSGLKY